MLFNFQFLMDNMDYYVLVYPEDKIKIYITCEQTLSILTKKNESA